MENIIEVKNLTKSYKNKIAVDNLTFNVKKGEILGILGKNGAGKSTLLKIVTGVVVPTLGEVKVNGKISSLLELGTAFNMELTGIENIYQHGQVMGLTNEEIEATKQDVIDAYHNILKIKMTDGSIDGVIIDCGTW